MSLDLMTRVEQPDLPLPLTDARPPCNQLWVAGTLPPAQAPTVAIVGSRTPSASGEHMAYDLAWGVARAGVTVVSGLARGVDSAAHRGAVDAGGRTLAVLGSGLRQIGIRSARDLAERIVERGAVVSEYPPDLPAQPYQFVKRNRLIAAWGCATVVVEAGARSGALITAGMALELNREVWAVPGDSRRPTCRGSNRLLRDGASMITDVHDLLMLLGLAGEGEGTEQAEPPGLTPAEQTVWRALAMSGAAEPEMLSRRTGLTAASLLHALSILELAGHVSREGEGFALARRDSARGG